MSDNLYHHPDLYDALMPAGAHLSYYGDLAQRCTDPVLELACGTGVLTVPIAAAGRQIAGLDLSLPMLTRARSRAAAAGVAVDFVEGDMRRFDLARRFSLVFVARNSLLHITDTGDLLALFAAVRRHLAPGGVFAFDVFTPSPEIMARPAGQRFPFINVRTDAHGELLVECANDYDAAAQVNRSTWYVSTATTPDAWVVPMVLRSIFPQELPLLVAAAGFELIERYGDLERRAFGPDSRRQVCVCRPRAST